MSIKNNKSLILKEIKKHYSIKSDADFARFLDIKPQTLSSWYSRNTFDIDLIYSKCVDIDGNWLLTGKGSMLKDDAKKVLSQNIKGNSNVMSGNDTSIIDTKSNAKELKEQLKECKKLLVLKDKEIDRQKKQIDKLFNMLPEK